MFVDGGASNFTARATVYVLLVLNLTQQAHDVVLTLKQRCLDINNVVTTLGQRRVLLGT